VAKATGYLHSIGFNSEAQGGQKQKLEFAFTPGEVDQLARFVRGVVVQHQHSTFRRDKWGDMLDEDLDAFEIRFGSKCVLELFVLPVATNGSDDLDVRTPIFLQVQIDRFIPRSPHFRNLLPPIKNQNQNQKSKFGKLPVS
jgi:hypothetical protein